MYRKEISVALAVVIYLIVPDILDRGETICFLWGISLCIYEILTYMEMKAADIIEKREQLSLKNKRQDLESRKQIPVNVRMKSVWPIIIPAQKVK